MWSKDGAVTLAATLDGALGAPAVVGTAADLTKALALARPPAADDAPPVQVDIVASDSTRLAGLVQLPNLRTEWQAAVTTRAAGQVALSWPSLLRQLPRGLVLRLEDPTAQQTVLLNTHAAYRYRAPAAETRRLKLTARYENLDRSQVTNLTATATRGRGLSVSLTLTGPAELVLSVRGTGGRLVKQLSQQAVQPGLTAVDWDGTDAEGRRVPRGIYVLEVVATSPNGAANRAVRQVMVPLRPSFAPLVKMTLAITAFVGTTFTT